MSLSSNLLADSNHNFLSENRTSVTSNLTSISYSSLLKPYNKENEVKYRSNWIIQQGNKSKISLKMNHTTSEKNNFFLLKYEKRIKTNYHLIIEEYDRETLSIILKL